LPAAGFLIAKAEQVDHEKNLKRLERDGVGRSLVLHVRQAFDELARVIGALCREVERRAL
jgi:hypothetical protein